MIDVIYVTSLCFVYMDGGVLYSNGFMVYLRENKFRIKTFAEGDVDVDANANANSYAYPNRMKILII